MREIVEKNSRKDKTENNNSPSENSLENQWEYNIVIAHVESADQ